MSTVPLSTAPVNSLSPDGWFTLYAANPEDHAGAIAAGDFNGDGVKDVVLTAAMGDGPQNQRYAAVKKQTRGGKNEA